MAEATSKSAVTGLIRALLQPIARLLLHCGVTWREFADIAKTAFVKVASEEFGIRGRPTNVSRVSILTGLGRREVRKQRDIIEQPAMRPIYLNSATRVLSGWHQDPDFLDAGGKPRELRANGNGTRSDRGGNGNGDEVSFEDLWRRYGGDVPVGALLKELVSVGAIQEVRPGRLRVVARTYIPRKFDVQKLLRAGEVLKDFSSTVVHDLTCTPDEQLRFERRAHTIVDARVLPEFRAMLEREGQAMLERVDAWLTANAATLAPPADEAQRLAVRLGVGIYHIQGEAPAETRQ